MREHVAKAICKEAGKSVTPFCVTCQDGECVLYYTFLNEADAAIAAVREKAQVFLRTPKKKHK